MGATCCPPQVDYQGSMFYKKIDKTMEKTGKPDLDNVFAKADDPLEQAERTRSKIAETFKTMTIITGTCVLKIPDLEQSIRSYLIRFLMELRLNAPTQGGSEEFDWEKFDLNNMFHFSQESPFLSFDEEKLKILQSAFKINPTEGELGEQKDAICEFLKTLPGIKKVFEEYRKECGEIKDEGMEFVSKLKLSDGVQELYREIGIGTRNLQKILNMTSVLQMIGEVGNQVAEAVEVFAKAYRDKNSFKQFDTLAKDMVEKKIFDMKKIVWETSNEKRLDKFEDWENNFEYREVGQIETK